MKPVLPTPKIMNALERDVPLLLKDAARDLRFTGRQVAKQLVDQIQQDSQQAPTWAPPLGQVAQAAMHMLDNLDRLAVNLVSPADEYRNMRFALLGMQGTGTRELTKASPRDFAMNFYWVFKHLLVLAQHEDVTVREEALHQAASAFQASLRAGTSAQAGEHSGLEANKSRAQHLARLTQILLEKRPLHVLSFLNTQDTPRSEDTDELTLRLVTAAVLTGEIAATHPGDNLQEEVSHALQNALLLANSRLVAFQQALRNPPTLDALSAEFAFVLRHL